MTNFLTNHQLGYGLGGAEDEVADDLYDQIMLGATAIRHDTPRLTITVRLHFRGRGRDAVSEKLSFHVREEEFLAVRLLTDHYLANYDTVHLLENPEGATWVRAHVVATDELASISLLAERVERDDEDVRRSKFTPGPDAAQTLGNPDTALDLSDFGRTDK